jgi:hypothetical protein
MANHQRNVEKLIAAWKSADFSRRHTVPEHPRGYNANYSNPDIERQRAIKEAEAAAKLAREFLFKRNR